MASGGCENCTTNNVVPYTQEDLEESGVETNDCADGCDTDALLTYAGLQEMIFSMRSDIESIRLEVDLLENMIQESADKDITTTAANSYITLMNAYIEKMSRLAQLETIYAHVVETKDGLAMFDSSSLTAVPIDMELASKRRASESAFQQVYVMEKKLLTAENASCLRVRISDYNALVEAYVAAHVAYLERYYRVQMSSWKDGRLLTRSFMCEDKLPCFSESAQHYFTNFAQVRVWVGNYSSESPDEDFYLDQQCYTYFTKENDYAYYWARKVPGTQSIQIKFFHSAYKNTTRHNVIWEVEKDEDGSSTPPWLCTIFNHNTL
jgi:hypothetical protein